MASISNTGVLNKLLQKALWQMWRYAENKPERGFGDIGGKT